MYCLLADDGAVYDNNTNIKVSVGKIHLAEENMNESANEQDRIFILSSELL